MTYNPNLPFSATFQTGYNQPEATWIINIRRSDGTPTIEYVRDLEGNNLVYAVQRIGDKMLVILTNGESEGTAKINLT